MAYKIKSKKKKDYYEMNIGGHKVRGKSKYEVQKKLNKMAEENAILWGYTKF